MAAIALGLGMWFVPSLSTQGAGTVGRQLAHPDRLLVLGSYYTNISTEARLHRADTAVRLTLPR